MTVSVLWSQGRNSRHPARIHLQKNLAGMCGFSSINIVCCTLCFARIYLDSRKSGENLCENRILLKFLPLQ